MDCHWLTAIVNSRNVAVKVSHHSQPNLPSARFQMLPNLLCRSFMYILVYLALSLCMHCRLDSPVAFPLSSVTLHVSTCNYCIIRSHVLLLICELFQIYYSLPIFVYRFLDLFLENYRFISRLMNVEKFPSFLRKSCIAQRFTRSLCVR